MPTTFTSGNDTYTVSAPGAYDLDFLAGDDRLNVYGGDSTTAHLGDGNDIAVIKAGLDTIYGDAGADRFDIYGFNATIDGGADNDTINVRGGTGLTAYGGLGADRFNFYADASSVALYGDDGDDDFFGYYHAVSGNLYGGAGNDYFVQFMAGSTLRGGLGNDIYRITVGSPPAVVENVGEGIDSVQVARGYSYTLADNVENISVQGFSGSVLTAAVLTGNALNNHIVGHNNDETMSGLDGNDSLSGKGGTDSLAGGNGNDFLDGGTGNDALQGGAGNDTLQGRSGDDAMTGGTGDDVYYVDSASDSVTELAAGGTDTVRVSVSGYVLTANVENGIIQSGVGGLVLGGNDLANRLTGSSGDDELQGLSGDDVLNAGAGDDYLDGGTGNDTMSGGSGEDEYLVSQMGDIVVENAGGGDADAVISELTDYTLTDNVENGYIVDGVVGILSGNDLGNLLIGADLGSTLNGNGGNDTLAGWLDGNDHLYGGEGNDLIYGAGGSDYMDGGVGADTYLFADVAEIGFGNDQVVIEWDDVVDLSEIDANPSLAGDQAFHYAAGMAGPDHTAGCLWLDPTQLGYHLSGDLDGDGIAEFSILLSGNAGDQWAITHIIG